MILMKRILVIAAVVSTLLGRSADLAAQAPHIGAVFPMSGPMGASGDVFREGIAIALAQLEQDKTLPEALQVNYVDGQGQPQPSVVAMNKLVKVSQEPYVMVAMSGISKVVAPVGDKDKVVMINGGGVASDLATLSPYFFNVIPLINYEVQELLPFLGSELKYKRIALIYVDDALGQAMLRELTDGTGKNGQELVGSFAISPTSFQFGAIAAKVREVKPDAVFVAWFGKQMIALLKQLRDNGVDQPIVGTSTLFEPEMTTLPAADGTIYTSQKMDWNAQDKVTTRFVADFKAKYGRAPSPQAANYYNAVMIYVAASQRLKAKNIPVTGAALREEMMSPAGFDVVGGKLAFQPDGTVRMPIQVYQIQKGATVALN
jgi:branched-chain amino acid transport system substrate-binding protein